MMVEMQLKMKTEHCVDSQSTTPSIVAPHTGMLDNEKLVVEEFILCYKRSRVLWDSKCGKNVTRSEKDQIYNELAQILGKIKRDCTVEDVKKKINALRSNYRRELRKVRRSEALARDNKEAIFQPTLWWYELMDFLEEVERPIYDVASIYLGSNGSIDMKEGSLRTEHGAKKRKHYKHERASLSSSYGSSAPDYTTPSLPQSSVHEYLPQAEDMRPCEDYHAAEQDKHMHIFKQEREDTNPTPLTNEYLEEIAQNAAVNGLNANANGHGAYLKSHDYNTNHMLGTMNSSHNPQSAASGMECNDVASSSYSYEHMAKNYKLHETGTTREANSLTEECDTFIYLARLWANKLRQVQPRQRLYAEKAINDIIFEAELGTLTRNSVKINET